MSQESPYLDLAEQTDLCAIEGKDEPLEVKPSPELQDRWNRFLARASKIGSITAANGTLTEETLCRWQRDADAILMILDNLICDTEEHLIGEGNEQ